MVSVERHASVEPYCVLCREPLVALPGRAWTFLFGGRSPEANWRLHVLGFYRIPSSRSSEEVRVHAFNVNVDELQWSANHESMVRLRSIPGVDVCSRPAGCIKCHREPESSVSLVHIGCFLLAHQRFKVDTMRMLHLIACRVYPLLPRGLTFLPGGVRYLQGSPVLSGDNVALQANTELGRLLSLIHGRLPVELQRMILDDLPDLFRALAFASRTLDWAVSSLATDVPRPVLTTVEGRPFADIASVEWIGASEAEVLDETCLVEIGDGSAVGRYHTRVRVSPDIAGIQVSLGTYGVAALRVLYADRPASPWLGTPRRWFTTYRCDSLKGTETLSDGLKLLRIGIKGHDSQPNSQSLLQQEPPLYLWNNAEASNFLRGRIRLMLDEQREPCFPVLPKQDLRLAYYLPFEGPRGGRGLRSLTMSINIGGVHSIMVDGDTTRRLGSTPGSYVLVTHFLVGNEFVTSVRALTWKVDDVLAKEAGMLFLTSHRRVLYFGAYPTLRSEERNVSTYTLPDAVKIVGLFCEPSWHMPICSLGVVAEPQTPSPSSSSNAHFYSHTDPVPVPDAAPELPDFAGHWMDDSCYLSRARLRGARTLSLQRRKHRCMGLLIEYEDGDGRAAEVLGQWDPAAGEEAASVLYDSRRDGPLRAVYFLSKGFGNPYDYIEDVCLEAPEVDDDSRAAYFEWTQFDEELAWWFTPEYDNVCAWEGTSRLLEHGSEFSSTEVA